MFTESHIHAVLAAQTIANIVKSSLGPMGLDKMLVDNIGVRRSPHVPVPILRNFPFLEMRCRKSPSPTMARQSSPFLQ